MNEPDRLAREVAGPLAALGFVNGLPPALRAAAHQDVTAYILALNERLRLAEAVVEADDPEPPRWPVDDNGVEVGIQRREWTAWRKRQDAREALAALDALKETTP